MCVFKNVIIRRWGVKGYQMIYSVRGWLAEGGEGGEKRGV